MNSGLVVAGMMTKVGWGYWIESKREVTDAALDCQVSKDLKKQIEAEIQKIPDIISYHNLWLRKAGKRSHIKKSHTVGPAYFVEVSLDIDSKLTLSAAHLVHISSEPSLIITIARYGS